MQRARPANDHRGGCSAEDYEIKGRTGVTGVTGPSVNACSRSRIHKCRVERIQRCIVHSPDNDADKQFKVGALLGKSHGGR